MTTLPNNIMAGQFSKPQIKALLAAASADDPALLSDLEGAGPIKQLEEAMANWLGVKHVLAVSSGTTAIHTALIAQGVGPGDEVIVTPYSWGQSVAPVLFCGATAVFADINPETLFLDEECIRKIITPKTKAILPVHLFGYWYNTAPLEKLAMEYDLALIHDAAHALGATNCNSASKDCRDIRCFSLGRGKLISGGEGGLLATDNSDIYEVAMSMTQHPARSRRELGPAFCNLGTADLGFNFRMHPLAAVLALADFGSHSERLNHRYQVWQSFNQGFSPQKQDVQVFHQKKLSNRASYGIALTCSPEIDRDVLVGQTIKNGLPLRKGPVAEALHLRLKDTAPLRVEHHYTHQPEACPVAEMRCSRQELWLLSGMEMDETGIEQAYEMGRIMAEISNNL